MAKKYFDDWDSHDAMWKAFANEWGDNPRQPEGMATDEEVLFAQYGQEGYEGSCVVLFVRDGKLYRVDGGHCSCYGLEGQWSPEETLWKAEAMRSRHQDYHMAGEAHAAFWALVDANYTPE